MQHQTRSDRSALGEGNDAVEGAFDGHVRIQVSERFQATGGVVLFEVLEVVVRSGEEAFDRVVDVCCYYSFYELEVVVVSDCVS